MLLLIPASPVPAKCLRKLKLKLKLRPKNGLKPLRFKRPRERSPLKPLKLRRNAYFKQRRVPRDIN